MILVRAKRLAILCPPKTGTTSLRKIFTDAQNVSLTLNLFSNERHWSIPQFKEEYPELAEEIDSCDLYGFYRNPLDRFVSFFNWSVRGHPDTIDPNISCENFVKENGVPVPQSRWLDYPNVNLLDFRNFEVEAKALAAKVGIVIDSIPKLNVSVSGRKVSEISTEDREFIKNLYRMDYEFLASKGITFSE